MFDGHFVEVRHQLLLQEEEAKTRSSFERLRLHVPVTLCAITPRFAHVSTDVFNMAIPIGSADDVDAQLAVLAIAIHILIVGGRLKVDAGGQSDELVHVVAVVDALNVSQTVEHLGSAH